jgi:hypothetical protein
VDLGSVWHKDVKAALACFPRASSLYVYAYSSLKGPERDVALASLAAHGKFLTAIHSPIPFTLSLIRGALRAEALPRVRNWVLDLQDAEDRALLTDGSLAGMHSIEVHFGGQGPLGEEELSALACLRGCRSVTRLRISSALDQRRPEGPWPHFLPSTLRELDLRGGGGGGDLLAALPAMLDACGGRLTRLLLDVKGAPRERGPGGAPGDRDGEAALRGVLHKCAATLRELELHYPEQHHPCGGGGGPSDVLAAVMRCRGLEKLETRVEMFDRCPPPAQALPALASLTLLACDPRFLSAGLWAFMGRGGLPALVELKLAFVHGGGQQGQEAEAEGGAVVGEHLIPAFEAVAGTLRRLGLHFATRALPPRSAYVTLGAAIGRLRRLRHLALDVSRDGRDYAAIGRGMATAVTGVTGGGKGAECRSPCPELWHLELARDGLGLFPISHHVEYVACEPSLIVPCVRVLETYVKGGDDALVLCGGLLRLGFCYSLRLQCERRTDAVDACVRELLRPLRSVQLG